MGGARRIVAGAAFAAGAIALAALSSCARLVPPAAPSLPVAPPVAGNAAQAGLARGPNVSSLHLTREEAGRALSAFVESCPALLNREDASGLTRAEDWTQACTAAASWKFDKARSFFETEFETARIAGGGARVTGYFEPEIEGSRTRRGAFAIPIYRLPPDLVRAWPAGTRPEDKTGDAPLGRFDERGHFVPYFDRAAIEAGALAGEGLEIAWVADWAEYYFLQVQGSGRVRTPDGEVILLRYAGKNGYTYTSIGALMRDQGLIGSGPGQYPGSMQGILRYLREHPEDGRSLMQRNRSWVFFREVPGDGPTGSLGVPVRAHASVAADPSFTPLGAPVFLALDDARANGLWIAQDTGGAIKGPNRFDAFWGFGDEAGDIAGTLSARGDALVLLPRGALGRLGVR